MITDDHLITRKFNKTNNNFSKELEIEDLLNNHDLMEKRLCHNKN